MHSLTVDRDIFSNKEKVSVVFPVTSVEVEVTGSEAMLALSFSNLSLKCKTGKVSTRVDEWQYVRCMSIRVH